MLIGWLVFVLPTVFYINSKIKIEGANNEKFYKPFDCIFTGVGWSCLELL